ncbi:hypothetical protein BVC93_01570 [Mycobacterium sp. MS1601]|uniref:helix-turn-helix domain-containing protein n=1 Tax=Mycobacterium sp. MS1601 TaxID=1936029 RepID=UPI0009792205|nr:helix-turn-helix transcriptional regulator [Mycobacterium sp. MS1601]AQA01333.1 hypothetical protein BVC93_01570 [Mycobacterium sp. MS1601]
MELVGNGDHDRRALGQRLRDVREHRGISLAMVAEALVTDAAAVAQMEDGSRDVSVQVLRRLATLYACPVDYLLGLELPAAGATAALTRVLNQLSMADHEQVLRFAQQIRRHRARTPELKLVHDTEARSAQERIDPMGPWNAAYRPRTSRPG